MSNEKPTPPSQPDPRSSISSEHDDQDEANVYRQLHRYNESNPTPLHERARNNSFHSMNSSISVEPNPFLVQSGLPGMNPDPFGSQPTHHINPAAIFAGQSGQSGQPGPSMWATSQPQSLALIQNTHPAASSAHHTVSRYGQYTPPEDEHNRSYAGGMAGGHFPMAQSPDDDLRRASMDSMFSPEFPPDSAQQPGPPLRKRRRRSGKEIAAPAADTDEQHKRDEFLARNRVAASKSRQKKKEWTQSLEEQLKNLQAEHTHLTFTVNCLRDQVIRMKNMCLEHVDCDCVKIREYMNGTLAAPAAAARQAATLRMRTAQLISAQPRGVPAQFGGYQTQISHQDDVANQNPDVDMPSIKNDGTVDSPKMMGDHKARVDSFTGSPSAQYPQMGPTASPENDSGSQERKLSVDDEDDEADDEEAEDDLSALWNEAVGDGDYMTGTAN